MVEGMKHVCYALALDERRVKFLPEYTYGEATQLVRRATIGPDYSTQDVRGDDQLLPTENLGDDYSYIQRRG